MILAQFALLEACLRFADGSSIPRSPALRPRSQDPGSLEHQSLIGSELPRNQLSGAIGIGGMAATGEEMPAPVAPTKASVRAKYCCNFWTWTSFGHYCEFLAILVALEAALFFFLQNHPWYIETIGYVALGLESTVGCYDYIAHHFHHQSI